MSTLINTILRLGALTGAALVLYTNTTHPQSRTANCHGLTPTACFQLVFKKSLLLPTAHVLAGALLGLLAAAAAALTLPLRAWQTLTRP